MNKYSALMVMGFLVACSPAAVDGKDDSGVITRGGNDGGDTPGNTDAGVEDASVSLEACIAGCSAKYPAAAAKNKMLDQQCFLGGACEPVCNNLSGGRNYEPDGDAGTCNTKAANSDPIAVPSQLCADCISKTAVCCNLWISIYGSEDGRALSKCAGSCYANNK